MKRNYFENHEEKTRGDNHHDDARLNHEGLPTKKPKVWRQSTLLSFSVKGRQVTSQKESQQACSSTIPSTEWW